MCAAFGRERCAQRGRFPGERVGLIFGVLNPRFQFLDPAIAGVDAFVEHGRRRAVVKPGGDRP